MRQTRLSFVTSRTLMENGGADFLADKDFTKAIDVENERLSFDFIIESFERSLNNLKKREFYEEKIGNNATQITSISEFNLMNLNVLHLDEHDLLTKNLEYLYKAREILLTNK